jgi:hypothetical protein
LLSVVLGALLSRQQCLEPGRVGPGFLAGAQVPVVPVIFSLAVSSLTPPLVLGMTAEIWQHGILLTLYVFGFFGAVVVVACVFLPVLVRLRISSIHEVCTRSVGILCYVTTSPAVHLAPVLLAMAASPHGVFTDRPAGRN